MTSLMTTSDGIKDIDWEVVIELASAVVNASADGADPAYLKRKLLKELEKLERKYGRLPSILSTKADYVVKIDERLSLLREAYSAASENLDFKNKVYISATIAELYVEEFNDAVHARYWVDVLERDLADYPDDEYFQGLHKELSTKLSG